MAAVKPYSGIVLPASFHGAVFQNTTQGPAARAKPVPLASGSNAVAYSQATFSSATQAWYTLSAYEQGLWDALAVGLQNGYSLFVAANQIPLAWGILPGYIPNVPLVVGIYDAGIALETASDGRVYLSYQIVCSDPLLLPFWLAVYWSPTTLNVTTFQWNFGGSWSPAIKSAVWEYLGYFGPIAPNGTTSFDVTTQVVRRLGYVPPVAYDTAPMGYVSPSWRVRFYANRYIGNYALYNGVFQRPSPGIAPNTVPPYLWQDWIKGTLP
jgi:hypothetical protein